MRGATSAQHWAASAGVFQSTLLIRGATIGQRFARKSVNTISIHAPHARSDFVHRHTHCSALPISIHAPHARSDIKADGTADKSKGIFQSTLLMRGATKMPGNEAKVDKISIHAPHARSDSRMVWLMRRYFIFQSTLLMRGATHYSKRVAVILRFQSTLLMRGATRAHSSLLSARIVFQSTFLMRGATFFYCPSASARRNFNPRSSCEERHQRPGEPLEL